MAELECDMDFLGNENRDEDVSLLRAGILEHSLKKNPTAEAQMGQKSKIILRSLLAMRDMIFSQKIWEHIIKLIDVHCGKYVAFRKV